MADTDHWPSFAGMTVDVVRCSTCRAVFVARDFPATVLEKFYTDETGGGIPATMENFQWWMQNAAPAMTDALDHIDDEPRGPLLDVGCGRGALLYLARKRGWNCLGLEINADMAKFVHEELGIPTQASTLDNADLPKDHFAVIALMDVIEHLYDPVTEVERCAAFLRPGGMLMVKTPNWRAQLVKEQVKRALRRGPGNIAYIGHINQFDRRSLNNVFVAAGLEPVGTFPAQTFLPAIKGAPFDIRRSSTYLARRLYNSSMRSLFRITKLNLSFNILAFARRMS